MSDNELSQYFWLKKEIKSLEDKIEEFGDGVGAVAIKETIVSGSAPKSSIQEKKMILLNQLTDARITALEKYIEIERYIETVEDIEIRHIMRLRFLDLKKWREIDTIMLCGKDYAKKKYYKYRKH